MCSWQTQLVLSLAFSPGHGVKEGRPVSCVIWKLIPEAGERGWQLSYSHFAPLELCPTGMGQRGAKLQLAGLLMGLTHVSLCPANSGTSCHNPYWAPSSQPCRVSHALGGAHQGWGGCPARPVGEVAEVELVLDGICELVHDPFVGNSGAVLWWRGPMCVMG